MLTKSEIAKLPIEQQEMLAQIELSKARHRQQLLDQARGQNDWRSDIEGICFCVLMGCWFFFSLYVLYYGDNEGKRYSLHVVLGIMSGLSFVLSIGQISSARIGRRLNALLELLDFDHKNQDDGNNSKDEKAG